MGDRLGKSPILDVEPFDERFADVRLTVPSDDGHRKEVVLDGGHEPVHHRQFDAVLFREVLHDDEPHAVCLDLLLRRGDLQLVRRDAAPFHGMFDRIRVRIGLELHDELSVLGHLFPLEVHRGDVHILQLAADDVDVGIFPGGEDADFIQVVPRGGVDGDHLDGLHRVHAPFYGAPDDVVHVPFFDDVLRQHVVRRQEHSPGGQPLLGERPDALRHVALGGALPHQDIDPVAQFFHALFLGGRFVARDVRSTAYDVRGQIRSKDLRRVAVDLLPYVPRVGGRRDGVLHDVVFVLVDKAHAGDALSLPDARHRGVLQHLLHVLGREALPRGLQSRTVRRQSRNPQVNVVGKRRALLGHCLDGGLSQDVPHLVGVGNQAGGPRGKGKARELRSRKHGRFKVHVRIDEARSDVFPRYVDDLRPLPRQRGAVPYHEDVFSGDGHIRDINFSGNDVDDVAPLEHLIRKAPFPQKGIDTMQPILRHLQTFDVQHDNPPSSAIKVCRTS